METRARNILNGLENQSKTRRLCDVVFFDGNRSVWAHSCVLAVFSSFFARLFAINLEKGYHWSLKQPMRINLKFISKCGQSSKDNCIECLAQIVNFMYTGDIAPDLTHLGHLFRLNERIKNDELFDACEKFRRGHSLVKLDVTRVDGEVADEEEKEDDEESARALECKICSYISDDSELMKMHSKSFHCNNYKCLGCKFSHKNVIVLVEHIERECKSPVDICSVCLVKFDSAENVKKHVANHSCSKPFKCGKCKRSFDRRSLWLKHVKTHLVDRKIQCSSCEKNFKTQAEYVKHSKVAHESRKFICKECGFSAAFSYLLEKHALKHRKKRFSCEQVGCGFQTSSEIMLIRHRAKHKGGGKVENVDKVNECSVCQAKFASKKNLVRHSKIHSGEKIGCSFCDFETTRVDKHKEHFESKHFDEGAADGRKLEPSDESAVTYTKEHNTLTMDDRGDISIVNSNERNSVTLRNIGNLTGSITLDERTGTLTMNNINSGGSVFLNEITGELTYFNFENDKSREMNYFENGGGRGPSVEPETTQLDEFTGEIVPVVCRTSADDPTQGDDAVDSEVDLNDDSFDDFDELLFDVFEGNEADLDGRSVLPRLDEYTGLLTFDENSAARDVWQRSFARIETNSKDETYDLLLDEVTGLLHD